MAMVTSNPSFVDPTIARQVTKKKKKHNIRRTPFASRRGSGEARGNITVFRNGGDPRGYVPARPRTISNANPTKFSKKQALIVFTIGVGLLIFLNSDGIASALGIGSGDIVQLEFLDDPPDDITDEVRSSFKKAAGMWNSALRNDLGSTDLEDINDGCRFVLPDKVKGIRIGVRIRSIDGQGGTLGSAGPCAIQRVDGKVRARAGVMTFDTADLIDAGSFQAVAAHEMGHVLGIGTLWADNDLINNNYQYVGDNGISGYEGIGGNGRVPVENQGGRGTINSHWRESVFNDELMTGYVEGSGRPNPLSSMTLKSMRDLGYTVNVRKANDYIIPSQRNNIQSQDDESIAGQNKLDLTNDVSTATMETVRRLRRKLDQRS
jgi:hypothetical protein